MSVHHWIMLAAGSLAGGQLLRRCLRWALLRAVLRFLARAALWLALLAVAWWASDRAAVLWVTWAARWLHHWEG